MLISVSKTRKRRKVQDKIGAELKRYSFVGIIFLSLVILDQLFKYVASIYLTADEPLIIIPGILWLTYVKNTGAAFGLAKGLSFYLSIFGLLSLALIFFWYAEMILKYSYGVYGASILAAGAFGNLIDRLRLGYVIDYLDVGFWPVFNFADVCITIGIALILIIFLKELKEKC